MNWEFLCGIGQDFDTSRSSFDCASLLDTDIRNKGISICLLSSDEFPDALLDLILTFLGDSSYLVVFRDSIHFFPNTFFPPGQESPSALLLLVLAFLLVHSSQIKQLLLKAGKSL